MIDTPDYDAMLVDYDDPMPIVTAISEVTEQPLPVIDEAHGDVATTVDTTPHDPEARES